MIELAKKARRHRGDPRPWLIAIVRFVSSSTCVLSEPRLCLSSALCAFAQAEAAGQPVYVVHDAGRTEARITAVLMGRGGSVALLPHGTWALLCDARCRSRLYTQRHVFPACSPADRGGLGNRARHRAGVEGENRPDHGPPEAPPVRQKGRRRRASELGEKVMPHRVLEVSGRLRCPRRWAAVGRHSWRGSGGGWPHLYPENAFCGTVRQLPRTLPFSEACTCSSV